MDNAARKNKIKETFNVASAGYDKPALRFFADAAEHLADSMGLTGSERILDVACGTGTVTLACAQRLGNGHVLGVDLSESMLEKAYVKAKARNLDNLAFKCVDIETMDFGANTFDGACCGFGIFFLPDMEAGLRNIKHHVKPNGIIAISSFTGAVMEPLSKQFIDRIQAYGVELPPLSWKRLDDTTKLCSLYKAAGMDMKTFEARTVQTGYHLTCFEEWWDILWYSGFRGLLNQLSESELLRFQQEHRKDIQNLSTEQGIWLNVEVLIAIGCNFNSDSR